MAATRYSIAGDILDTDDAALEAALASPSWRLRRGNDDAIQVRGDKLSMEIYADRPGQKRGSNYLVSATMDGDASEVRAVVEEIAGLLAGRGIVYSFEFMEDSGSDEEIIRHPDFPGRDSNEPTNIVFTCGAEWAPDSPYGLDIIELNIDGRVRYENRMQGKVMTRTARAEPGVWEEIKNSLFKEGMFPRVPSHDIPPGSGLVEFVSRDHGVETQAQMDYHAGLKLPGYGDAIRRFDQWASWLRGDQSGPAPAGLSKE